MNCVNLFGKVIDDPNKATSANGLELLRFKIAIDKSNKENGYEVYEIVAFKDVAQTKLEVGDYVGVTGRLSSNNFEKEGKTYYNCSIIANYLTLCGK